MKNLFGDLHLIFNLSAFLEGQLRVNPIRQLVLDQTK
jgi:hypothetical protein